MRNPYKKFQNSSVHDSKVMLCIKKRDERTNNPEAICPSNFFEVGGIIKKRPCYACCQHTQIYQTLHAVLSETTIVTNTMYGPQSFYWQTIKTLIGWMRAVI